MDDFVFGFHVRYPWYPDAPRNIRAILLECTELPPYADALRYHTGLPVWDAITVPC